MYICLTIQHFLYEFLIFLDSKWMMITNITIKEETIEIEDLVLSSDIQEKYEVYFEIKEELVEEDIDSWQTSLELEEEESKCPENDPLSIKKYKDENKKPNNKITTQHATSKQTLLEKCYICDASFSSQKDLTIHFSSVHDGKKPFKCLFCVASFSRKQVMIKHIASVHEGKKPFKCSICDGNFTKKDKLNRHISAVHEKKKPFKCSGCDSSFSFEQDMKRHIASIHEGKTPFQCSICDKYFSKRSNLQLHIVSVHERRKPHKCTNCNSSFAQKQQLEAHIAGVHEKKNLCDLL